MCEVAGDREVIPCFCCFYVVCVVCWVVIAPWCFCRFWGFSVLFEAILSAVWGIFFLVLAIGTSLCLRYAWWRFSCFSILLMSWLVLLCQGFVMVSFFSVGLGFSCLVCICRVFLWSFLAFVCLWLFLWYFFSSSVLFGSGLRA